MATQRETMCWGALAGAIPVITQLLAIDPAALLSSFAVSSFIGYVLKSVILMGLGALVVRLNEELDIKKAFQLGIMAPALLVGIETGKDFNQQKTIAQQLPAAQSNEIEKPGAAQGETSFFGFIISGAYADDTLTVPATPKGLLNNPSEFKQFWYALIGGGDDGWFVIAGSYRNKDDAEKFKQYAVSQGWKARVGAPASLWGGYYPVIVGSYLSQDEATAIRDLAIQTGLRKDAYIWRH